MLQSQGTQQLPLHNQGQLYPVPFTTKVSSDPIVLKDLLGVNDKVALRFSSSLWLKVCHCSKDEQLEKIFSLSQSGRAPAFGRSLRTRYAVGQPILLAMEAFT